jgi:hypothetical protein
VKLPVLPPLPPMDALAVDELRGEWSPHTVNRPIAPLVARKQSSPAAAGAEQTEPDWS